MLKILFWDENGLCLFTKRLDHTDAGAACDVDRGHRLASARACLETSARRLKSALSLLRKSQESFGFWAVRARFDHVDRSFESAFRPAFKPSWRTLPSE